MTQGRDFRSDTFKPVAQAIGEMTLAWNDLHQILGVLFWTVNRIPNAMASFAVWHSSRVDRAQREMLQAVLDAPAPPGRELNEALKDEIRWILSEVKKLEDLRNDAVHSPILVNDAQPGGVGVAAQLFGHQRAKKLANKDLVREFRWFYDAVVVLRDHAATISVGWDGTTHAALPERPPLPNRGDPVNAWPHRY